MLEGHPIESKAVLDIRRGGARSETTAISINPSDPLDSLLVAPKLISPIEGATFDTYPRRTSCVWEPTPGAVSYILEWDYSYNGVWDSEAKKRPGVGFPVKGTQFTFGFVGAQPGRWRVWPVNPSGQRGQPSEWRTFRYLR